MRGPVFGTTVIAPFVVLGGLKSWLPIDMTWNFCFTLTLNVLVALVYAAIVE